MFFEQQYTRFAVILLVLSQFTFIFMNKIIEINEYLGYVIYSTWTLLIFLVGNHYPKPSDLMIKLKKIRESTASRERKRDKYEEVIDEAIDGWDDMNQSLLKNNLKKEAKEIDKKIKRLRKEKIK